MWGKYVYVEEVQIQFEEFHFQYRTVWGIWGQIVRGRWVLLESIEVGPGEAPGVGAHGVKLRHNWTQWGGDHTMEVGGTVVGGSWGETNTFYMNSPWSAQKLCTEKVPRVLCTSTNELCSRTRRAEKSTWVKPVQVNCGLQCKLYSRVYITRRLP